MIVGNSESGLICIAEDTGRLALVLTRDEAYKLQEDLIEAIRMCPVDVSSNAGGESPKEAQPN